MGRPRRSLTPWLTLACFVSTACALKRPFSIHDDILAYPQYRVVFPDEYVLESKAEELLRSQASAAEEASLQDQSNPQVYSHKPNAGDTPRDDETEQSPTFAYEEMIMDDRRLLCQIPQITTDDLNSTTNNQVNEAEQQKELARATDRGLELLREMEGKCMYYFSGWWSYSFCYRRQIKQFHALPAGRNVPQYPPMEDPTTHSFILGQFPANMKEHQQEDPQQQPASSSDTDVAELHTKGGSRYLVQHLQGGTTCDLTGRERRVEVQFHCHPQSTDHIGWIKELTTCSYLMVIYTPRLCDDVAFLPPQQDEIHDIQCREILMPQDVPDWEAMKVWYQSEELVEAAEALAAAAELERVQIVGGIEVGARKLVGMEGKVIEKGHVATTAEERTEAVVKREKGEVKLVSEKLLKKYDVDQKKLEEMQKRLDKLAQGKDWTLEVVVENNGVIKFQGIVEEDKPETPAGQPQKEVEAPREENTPLQKSSNTDTQQDSSESKSTDKQPSSDSGTEDEKGSEEVFKDEL